MDAKGTVVGTGSHTYDGRSMRKSLPSSKPEKKLAAQLSISTWNRVRIRAELDLAPMR